MTHDGWEWVGAPFSVQRGLCEDKKMTIRGKQVDHLETKASTEGAAPWMASP